VKHYRGARDREDRPDPYIRGKKLVAGFGATKQGEGTSQGKLHTVARVKTGEKTVQSGDVDQGLEREAQKSWRPV